MKWSCVNLHGRFLKHDRAMDVCFEVLWCLDVGHKIKMKGKWWNMAYVNSYDIFPGYKPAKIEIRKEDLGDWKQTKNQQLLACLRNCDWRPLIHQSGQV